MGIPGAQKRNVQQWPVGLLLEALDRYATCFWVWVSGGWALDSQGRHVRASVSTTMMVLVVTPVITTHAFQVGSLLIFNYRVGYHSRVPLFGITIKKQCHASVMRAQPQDSRVSGAGPCEVFSVLVVG